VTSPAVSVVIPAYRAPATLSDCVAAVLAQPVTGGVEVVVVASADHEADLPAASGPLADRRVRLITAVPRVGAAAARNRGVDASTGRALAFTDADAVPAPDWLPRLLAAAGDSACVAGGVRNGTPRSAAGTAEYLIQFLDLHPARPAATAWHGATVNMLVTRDGWDRFGPFPEDMDGGEDTLFTVLARREGAFRFAGDATVTHMNRTGLRAVLRHQYEFGRFTARLIRRTPYYKGGVLVRSPALAPVAAAGRVVSLYARVAAWTPGTLPWALALSPVVVAGLTAWAAGLISEGRGRRSPVKAWRWRG
jgi:glycosyltransferase involved in cell wall biosynthesis